MEHNIVFAIIGLARSNHHLVWTLWELIHIVSYKAWSSALKRSASLLLVKSVGSCDTKKSLLYLFVSISSSGFCD